MAAVLGMIVVYFVLQILLLAVAVAIGFGLHWCIPDLNIGIGILVGMLSSIATAYFLVQLMKIGFIREVAMDDLDDEDEDGEDEIKPELHISAPPVKRRRQRRKR